MFDDVEYPMLGEPGGLYTAADIVPVIQDKGLVFFLHCSLVDEVDTSFCGEGCAKCDLRAGFMDDVVDDLWRALGKCIVFVLGSAMIIAGVFARFAFGICDGIVCIFACQVYGGGAGRNIGDGSLLAVWDALRGSGVVETSRISGACVMADC